MTQNQISLLLKKQIYQNIKEELKSGIVVVSKLRFSDRYRFFFNDDVLSSLIFKLLDKIPLKPIPEYSFLEQYDVLSIFPDEEYYFEFMDKTGNSFFHTNSKQLESIFANPPIHSILSMKQQIYLFLGNPLIIKITKITPDGMLRKEVEKREKLLEKINDPEFKEILTDPRHRLVQIIENFKNNITPFDLKRFLHQTKTKCLYLRQKSLLDQKYHLKF